MVLNVISSRVKNSPVQCTSHGCNPDTSATDLTYGKDESFVSDEYQPSDGEQSHICKTAMPELPRVVDNDLSETETDTEHTVDHLRVQFSQYSQ